MNTAVRGFKCNRDFFFKYNQEGGFKHSRELLNKLQWRKVYNLGLITVEKGFLNMIVSKSYKYRLKWVLNIVVKLENKIKFENGV